MADPHLDIKFVDVSDRFVIWHKSEIGQMPLKTGAVLIAEVTGEDVGIITWTVHRRFDDQCIAIAGRQELTIGAARAAAEKAMKFWCDTYESGEPVPVVKLSPG